MPQSQLHQESPIVLLVDTGRRSRRWIRPGAGLPAAIQQALPNALCETHAERRIASVRARRASVARLRQRLRHLATTAQGRPIFVAAQGHGGSLVLRSLQEESLDGRIAGVICLDTPFVYAWRRQLGPLLSDLADALPVFVFAAWLAAALVLFAAGVMNLLWLAVAGGGTLVAATLAMLAAGRAGLALRIACERVERDASQLAALPTLRKTPLLVLSAADEGAARLPWTERLAQAALAELGRALACSAAVVRATKRISKARHALLLGVASIGIVGTMASPQLTAWPLAIALAVPVSFVVATVGVTGLAALTFFAASFVSMRRLPSFGPERLVHRVFASVSADRVPFGFPGVTAPPLAAAPGNAPTQAQALAVDWIRWRIVYDSAPGSPAASRPERPASTPRAEFVAPTAWMPTPAAIASHAS